MAKFEEEDRVYIRRNAARSRNDILGRNKPGARVSVELRTRPIVGKVLQYGGRPIVEYSPTTRTRFTGTLIKQNGYKWDIKSDSGEIYKDVSEADFDLIDSSNAARNADTPEGRKIIERAKGRYAAVKDPGQLANVRDDILRGISRSSAIPDDEKDAIEGEVIYLHGEALRKLGFNAVRSRNAVVQKALNAMARNIRAIPVDSKGKGIIERCKIRTADGEVAEVSHIDEDGFVYFKAKDGRIRGVPADTVVRLNAETSVLRETALNAATRNANFRGSVWDRALAVSVRPKFSKGNRVKVVGHPMEDGVRGIVEKTFPSGQVLITTGYDKDGHPYTVQVHQSYLVRNSVVQKALNAAAARNATVEDVIKGLDSGKYDSVAIVPRESGMPESRSYVKGLSYSEEDELRDMIKSGKYVELLFYKDHSLKGRVALNWNYKNKYRSSASIHL